MDETTLNTLAKEIDALKEQNKALVKSVTMLSNTLHVLDAANLLALHSLKTKGLITPLTFTSNKDIQESGVPQEIARAFNTLAQVNKHESESVESR